MFALLLAVGAHCLAEVVGDAVRVLSVDFVLVVLYFLADASAHDLVPLQRPLRCLGSGLYFRPILAHFGEVVGFLSGGLKVLLVVVHALDIEVVFNGDAGYIRQPASS